MEQAMATGFIPDSGASLVVTPMVLLGLAQAYERTGDRTRALERVDALLRRWDRADADLPALAEARALRKRLAPKTAQATQR
jgi:hypothetical protein